MLCRSLLQGMQLPGSLAHDGRPPVFMKEGADLPVLAETSSIELARDQMGVPGQAAGDCSTACRKQPSVACLDTAPSCSIPQAVLKTWCG